MDIRLDKSTFKALASGTRVDILKLLGERRHMQSELAESLELSVPTVKEHLSALSTAGLVERHDEGRKWKYYSLTRKGKGILNPDEMKIWIVLGLFLLSAAGGFMSLFSGQTYSVSKMSMESAPMAEGMEAVKESLADAAPQSLPPMAEASNWPSFFFIAAIVLVIVLIYLIMRSRSYKKQLGKSLTKK